MFSDRTEYIDHLEKTLQVYYESIAKGEVWARVPIEITEHFLALLRRDRVSAAEAIELVRRCDEHQMTKGGILFFTMCNTIREWYRDIYERELRETL